MPRVLIAVLVLALGALAAWLVLGRRPADVAPAGPAPAVADPPVPDPRLTFDTPFRNVKPHVQYVGDERCAGCHADIDKRYHAHPMGRSAAFVAAAPPLETFGPGTHDTFTKGPYTLRVERAGGKVIHRVSAKDAAGAPLPEYVATADLAIGSGTRGKSYLCLQQGAAWQTPISWYSPDGRWDLSPGFDLGNGGRRPVGQDCLTCHVNRVEPVPQSVNRFRDPFPAGQAGIGCERCHGPGELHVAERAAGKLFEKIDTSIVNPKHLSAPLQAGICAQCHLQGEDRVTRRGRQRDEFRPGLPIGQFVTVFVRHPDLADAHRSVGQFEQMAVSKCRTNDGHQLGCTACHDPHGVPPAAARDAFYAGKCATCHAPGGKTTCSEPLAKRQANNDNCVACHMPKAGSSNIVHASVTDHRLARRPAPTAPTGLKPGAVPLVRFSVGGQGPPEAEWDRDLGIALARAAGRAPEGSTRTALGTMAEGRLTTALELWPGDVPALSALALSRAATGDRDGRFAAAATAAELAPDSEVAKTELADAAASVGKLDIALAAATDAVRMSPTAVEPLVLRAGVYLRQKDWERAEADCRAALAIHPLFAQARLMLGVCRHRRGDPAGGEHEAETAAGLASDPRRQAAMMEWYYLQIR